jgi:hypothetical protein
MRKQIANGEKVDCSVGSYGQLLNTYQGLMAKLGMESQVRADSKSLDQHIAAYNNHETRSSRRNGKRR